MIPPDGKLALLGGAPVRAFRWPKWPRADAGSQRQLLDVLHSTKWTLSGRSDRSHSYERRFGEAFAHFIGQRFAVPCSSGTSALTISLQAVGVGFGDEVIVPGMTWVACASAVCNLGAVPVLVDVDADSLCVGVAAVAAAITNRTRAVIAVHLYSARADVPGLRALCDRYGIALIEDASQSHGALVQGRRSGAYGHVGAFSLQQTKLLTSGEGGVAVTDDEALFRAMQEYRADGRQYWDEPDPWSFKELTPIGTVMGRNLCLSEFHAALVHARLPRLDEENAYRRANADKLRESLSRVEGIRWRQSDAFEAEGATFYKMPLTIDMAAFPGLQIRHVARALSAELNLAIEPLDAPLNNNTLYKPHLSPQTACLPIARHLYDPRRFSLPNATAAHDCCVALPHWCLLGTDADLALIAEAFQKVRAAAPALRRWAETQR